MLVLAEGLFRLDVSLSGDTLRTIVRNLSAAELSMRRSSGYPVAAVGFGDIEAHQPSQAKLGFVIGEDADRVEVDVTVGTLRFADRGTVKVSAQAIIAQPPAS